MDDRRRFYLVGGRTIFVATTPSGRTRTHVSFESDEDGVFWPVCGTPGTEREALMSGWFEVLRGEASCKKCRVTREPMLPRAVPRGPGESYRRKWG